MRLWRLLSERRLLRQSRLRRVVEGTPQKLAPEALNELLAPIALYPDALIALILPASTVPADLVLAARYIASNGDPAQIANQPWDDSVKSLVRYPDVLKWMDQNLEWTTALGDAFLDQPADVMNSIQALRAEAIAAGNLTDTPQQRVVREKTCVRIVPAEPEVIYVPQYDPEVVYVQPYSEDVGPLLTFSAGFAVGSWLNYDCDWDRRGIYVGQWRPGWKRDRDWDRGGDWDRDRDWDRGGDWDRDRDWDRGDRDRGDRGPNNNIVNVVNINSDTARQWQPSASSQRQQAREQRVRRSNTRFSNVETSNVNRARGGPSATGLPEAADSRINQIPKPSRLGIARQGRERDRRNEKADRDSRSNELPAASIPATDAAQGNNQKVSEPGADPNVAGEQGTPGTRGEQGRDPRNVSKQGRDNRQGTGTGGQNATSEARGKNRKAPQPTAPPNVAGEQGTPPASGDQQSAVSNVNKQEKSSRPKSAAVDASRDRGRQASNDGQGGGPRDSKKNAQSGASSQPPAANTGAPKQKQQKQVNQAQGAPPQPGTSQQRSNERKREQKPPSQPAAAKQNKPPPQRPAAAKQNKPPPQQPAAAKQNKPPPQRPAAAKQNQQPQRSAAPQQKAPSKPPNAPQGKGKGKGGGEKKPDEKKNEGGN